VIINHKHAANNENKIVTSHYVRTGQIIHGIQEMTTKYGRNGTNNVVHIEYRRKEGNKFSFKKLTNI